MKFITVSELRLRATEVVREIEETKEDVIVTKKGKPVVLMRFIEHGAFSLKETEKEKRKVGEKKRGKRNL
jgi:PHD/YefM family antitoxin component YafN of YafNO toxin-antitoxin module